MADLGLNIGVWVTLAGLLIYFLSAAFKILREYERAVIYTLGRYTSTSGPGLIILIPVLQQMVRRDIRIIAEDVASQDVISQDNVSVKVNAVLYYRIVDPGKAVNNVANFREATSQLAQTTLRSVLGKHDLDEMLTERDKLNMDIQKILDDQTEAWGIKVSNVEIKHVDLDQSMIRAIARQAEAERERRARVISAEGEQQAAAKLAEAAELLAQQEGGMQLRYLGTLQQIGVQGSSTIVFPMPLDMVGRMMGPQGGTLNQPPAGGSGGATFDASQPPPMPGGPAESQPS